MATGGSNHRNGSPPLGPVSVLQQLRGHTSDVTSCDFAPNFTLVTGSSDKTVCIWEWKSVEKKGYMQCKDGPLLAHKYGVTCVKVSPQGAMLVTASVDGTAILWALRPLVRLHTFVQVNGDPIRMCRFAPNSAVLATGSQNGAICVWDLVHKSLIRSIFKHEGTVQSLAFTWDSQLLVSGCSDSVLNVWSVAELTDTTSDGTPSPLASIDNAHDLGILSCDSSRVIKTDDNNPLRKMYSFVTSGNDNEVKIWQITYTAVPKHVPTNRNTYRLQLEHTLQGHQSAVTTVRFNSSGSLLGSAGLDKTVRLWKFQHNAWDCIKVLESHSRYVNCIAFSKDTVLLASGSNDKTTLVWSLIESVKLDSELIKPSDQILVALNAAQGSVQETEVVRHTQLNNDVQLIETLDDISEGAINSCRFFGNNTLATASGDKLVKLFHISEDVHAIEELSTSPFEGHTYPVNHVDFYRNGSKLVSCSLDGSVIVWETQSGSQLYQIPVSNMSIRVCKYSADGRFLVTAGDDEVVRLWDIDMMSQLKCLEGHAESITSAAFSADSSVLATVCNNGTIRLWRVPCGTLLHFEIDGHDLGVQGCDFSFGEGPVAGAADTFVLATCGNDSLVKVWLVFQKGKIVQMKLWKKLEGHGGNVMSVRFSPHTGEILASTATDRQCRLWGAYSGQCLHVLEHESMGTCCDFSEDTSMLAVGCLGKTLSLWKLPQTLVFQTKVANKIKNHKKAVVDWRTEDVAQWITEVGLPEVAQKILSSSLDGSNILTLSADQICSQLELSEIYTRQFTQELDWLRQDELNPKHTQEFYEQIPNEYLCPITHELMQWPVTCTDGFTYERQAITEWFLSGRYTSPMTNENLPSTDFTLNRKLRHDIHRFLYGSSSNGNDS